MTLLVKDKEGQSHLVTPNESTAMAHRGNACVDMGRAKWYLTLTDNLMRMLKDSTQN